MIPFFFMRTVGYSLQTVVVVLSTTTLENVLVFYHVTFTYSNVAIKPHVLSI